MPLYDFRCTDCAAEREVRASFAEASALQLVCTGCGGTMAKALSKSAPAALRSGTAAPPPHPRRGTRRGRARTCEDGAVKLTRPNPLAARLPSHQSAEAETKTSTRKNGSR